MQPLGDSLLRAVNFSHEPHFLQMQGNQIHLCFQNAFQFFEQLQMIVRFQWGYGEVSLAIS
jgi:hypothetical protein